MLQRRKRRHRNGEVVLRVRNMSGNEIQAPLQSLDLSGWQQPSWSRNCAGSSVGTESGPSGARGKNSCNSSGYVLYGWGWGLLKAMRLWRDRRAWTTQLGQAGRLECFPMWANELKALLKMLDIFWHDKPACLWISSSKRDLCAAYRSCWRRGHCPLDMLQRSSAKSDLQKDISKVGLCGHRAGERSAERGCQVATKVHALPLLSLLFFFKLLDDQPILFPLHSLESVRVGLSLMPMVAQELFFSSLSLCPALTSFYLCQSKG